MKWSTAVVSDRSIESNSVQARGLSAENAHLRQLLVQSSVDAQRHLLEACNAASESESALRLQQLLIEELHHRSKNSLAVVKAIASQTLKNAGSVEAAQIALDHRLTALGRAQSLLLSNLASASLCDVVRAAIEPFDDPHVSRFDIESMALDVSAGAVLPISLSLNELCTNAVKYGALSVTAGRVAIALSGNDDAKRINFKWTETGGPKVHKPSKRSFGTKLIELMAGQIAAGVSLRYEPEGFTCELDIPLAGIQATAAQIARV